jgi:chromosome partitioning protein
MRRIVAIANFKGGTAKSTTAVNLAAGLAELGHNVLLIDLDPQASATAWLGARDDDGSALFEAFVRPDGDLVPLVRSTPVAGLDLVATGKHLLRAERELLSLPGHQSLLSGLLRQLPDRWDFVLLDCPPFAGTLTANAFGAASEVLAPVEASGMALDALAELKSSVLFVRRGLNPQLRISAVLPCRVRRTTRLGQDALGFLATHYPDLLLGVVIRECVKVAECWGHQLPVTVYAPRSSAAEDYRRAALAFASREVADVAA